MSIELIEGLKPKPFFKTEEQYQRFRERYANTIKPFLDKQKGRRALSEDASRRHYVD